MASHRRGGAVMGGRSYKKHKRGYGKKKWHHKKKYHHKKRGHKKHYKKHGKRH